MLENKNNLKGWLYLLPALVLMGIFTFYPLVKTFTVSFLDGYNSITGNFSGITLNNYIGVFSDSDFLAALKNTFVLVFLTVPLSVGLSLLIALGLHSIKPLKKVFQTIFFIPYVTNVIAIGMVFSVMFSTETGLINLVLDKIGINPINWIGPASSWWTQILVAVFYITWSGLPFKILIFLGGLQGIDKQYYQAAQIDNAPKAKVVRRITIPLLSPILAYVLITSFIGAFKEYTAIISIFGGDYAGPAGNRDSLQTIVYYIYGFIKNPLKMGTASAGSVILLIIIMFFTLINMYISKKKVHY